jgi:uncharacterized protein YjbI with pentapeptide repeats
MPERPRKPVKGIEPPFLPKLPYPDCAPELPLPDKVALAQVTLRGSDLTGQAVSRPHFEELFCVQVIAAATQFDHLRQEDVRWTGANLANALWPNVACSRVEFASCRMTGFAALEGTFHDTLFHECKGDLSRWYGATFRAARFVQCVLTGADFRSCDLTGVVFAGCDLSGVDFTGATLKGADLRGCPITGMRVGAAELKGATIDEGQALAVMRSLGITIG